MKKSRIAAVLTAPLLALFAGPSFAIDDVFVGTWDCTRGSFVSTTTITAEGYIKVNWETKITGYYEGSGLTLSKGLWRADLAFFTPGGNEKSRDIKATLEMDGAEMRQNLVGNARDLRMKCKRK